MAFIVVLGVAAMLLVYVNPKPKVVKQTIVVRDAPPPPNVMTPARRRRISTANSVAPFAYPNRSGFNWQFLGGLGFLTSSAT